MSGPSLSQFVTAVAVVDGLELAALPSVDQIAVRTRNTLYQITKLDDGCVMVRGGRFFPDWTRARLAGSTLGGSLLKLNWIGRGFCMEFLQAGQRIVTTRVKEIHRIAPPASAVC